MESHGISRGKSAGRTGGSPRPPFAVSLGGVGGSWRVISRAMKPPNAGVTSPRVPCRAGGEAALLRFLCRWAGKRLWGAGSSFTLPPAGQDLWPGSVMRKEGDPPAPGAPGLLPVLAVTSPPPCPSFPALPSLLVPAGISRSFLPTRRCRFSFPALHPCLETVAWRRTPGSSMF